MPTWAATLIVGAVTVLCNALLTAFYYGRLSERVDGHTKELAANDTDQNNQWGHINDLRADMGKVKGKLSINGGGL